MPSKDLYPNVEDTDSSGRVAFVHGRPGPHPFHRSLAESVNADFYFVDFVMRWHDRNTSKVFRYFSMLVCGLFFPHIERYSVILSEGLHAVAILAKKSRPFRKQPIAVALMASETLYFLSVDFYSPWTRRILVKTLSSYDALICVGRMQEQLANKVLSQCKTKPRIFHISGSSTSVERQKSLCAVEPNLESLNVLFIANGVIGWRAWYKGIDVLLDALPVAAKAIPGIKLNVVGDWSPGDVDSLFEAYPQARSLVNFAGKTSEIENYLQQSSLYVHIGRGDAFPVAVLESMLAGVPCIVSDWTGTREPVSLVNDNMVVPVDTERVAAAIVWYLNLTINEKTELSNRSRTIARKYDIEVMLSEFRNIAATLASQ